MMKLSLVKAQIYIDRAIDEKDKNKSLRFGQALWNLLYQDFPDLMNHFHASQFDFFYETDNKRVMDIFFEHYVGDIV